MGPTDLQKLTNAVSWGYTWEVSPGQSSLSDWEDAGIDFVPMVWGEGHVTRGDIGNTPPDSQALLGFNEPNFPDQANMLPQAAADLWPELEKEAVEKNIPSLVSPAVNFATYHPIAWLDEFFGNCTGCKVDAIGVHSYTCQVEYLHNHLSMYYKYGLPLWLTEFACADDTTKIDAAGQAEYMKEAIPYLEESSYVAKYAWFSYDFGSNNAIKASLFDSVGLTPLGEMYRDLEGDPYYATPIVTENPTASPTSHPTASPTLAPVDPPPPCTGFWGDPYAPGEHDICCPGLSKCLGDHFNNGWWHYRCYYCCQDPHGIPCN